MNSEESYCKTARCTGIVTNVGPRQVVVQGAREAGKAAFFFLEEILGIIDQVLLHSMV